MERYIKYLSTLAALFVFWIITFLAGARLFGCGFGTLEKYLERYWGGFSSVNVRCIYWLLLQLPVYLWIYFRQIGRMKWIYPQVLLRGGNFRRYHRLEMLKNAGLVLRYYFMGVGETYLLSSFCGVTVIGDISFVVQTLFRQTVGMGSLLLFALILHEAAFPAVESFVLALLVQCGMILGGKSVFTLNQMGRDAGEAQTACLILAMICLALLWEIERRLVFVWLEKEMGESGHG